MSVKNAAPTLIVGPLSLSLSLFITLISLSLFLIHDIHVESNIKPCTFNSDGHLTGSKPYD